MSSKSNTSSGSDTKRLKFGIAVGWMSAASFAVLQKIYETPYQPDFIVFCLQTPPVSLPRYNPLKKAFVYLRNYRHWLIKYSWRRLLFFLFFSRQYRTFKNRGTRISFVRDLNEAEFEKTMIRESPQAVFVLNCGILKPGLLERFPQTFINAHAGKFPEYRGMNNVEWACFENRPITGTIHFIDKGIDTGNILLQEELTLPAGLKTINALREAAFEQTRFLLPKALQLLANNGEFKGAVQEDRQIVRYEMHPFLKSVLALKLQTQP